MAKLKKKDKGTSNNLQNTTKKTKHKLYIKPGQGAEGEPRCSGMVSSACSIGATINFSSIRLTSIFGTCKLNDKHHTSIVADLSDEYLKNDSKEDRFCPFQLNLAFVLYFLTLQDNHCR